jgi:hypothetical protein
VVPDPGALYWLYPRQPRNAARLRFDAIALLLAFAGCLASLYWSFGIADRSHGQLWPQILATSVGYGVFLAVLTCAVFLRRRMLARLLTNPRSSVCSPA